MSHELLQEIYEKEKKTYDSFPTVTAKSVVSNYMSKRKLTQKTDKLFKSMNISSKKPKNSQEIELLSIKNKKTQSINPQNYVKASHKLRKLRNKNGSFSDNLQSRNELKQLETKLLNPFQTSYKSQFLNQGAIKWIPKRYGSNKNQRNFANNFYNTNPETTLEETDFLTNNDASDQIIKRFFEKDNANVSKDEKTNDEINKNNDGNNSNNLNNNKNNENTVKNNKKNDNSNNIHNNNIKNSNNDNDNNNEDDILHGSEQREICIFDENLKSNNTEEEIINIAPLSKTEYFKILNIGYHHLKNYKLPLEKLNEIIKENEEFFKHLAGFCKCVKCTCGLHKCDFRVLKFNYSFPFQTIYKEDYSQKSLSLYSSPTMKTEVFNQKVSDFKTQGDFVKESTTKSDFTDPHGVYVKPLPNHQFIEESPVIYKHSHYQREFPNYGSNPFIASKIQQTKTVIKELPFYGVTTYNQNFLNFSGKNSRIDFTLPAIPNPLKSNSSQIMNNTTNRRDFKPYSISLDRNKYGANDDEVIEKFSFPGQYKTTTSKDFLTLKRSKCPFAAN